MARRMSFGVILGIFAAMIFMRPRQGLETCLVNIEILYSRIQL